MKNVIQTIENVQPSTVMFALAASFLLMAMFLISGESNGAMASSEVVDDAPVAIELTYSITTTSGGIGDLP